MLQVCVEEGENQQLDADDQAHHRRRQRVRPQPLLHHAEAPNAQRPHQHDRPGEKVGRHGDKLELELAHKQLNCRCGVRAEAARESPVKRKDGEEARTQLDEEASNTHNHVETLHEMDPRMPRPVHGRIRRHATKHRNRCSNGREQHK
eukprot:6195171-Pleurochrysis_carterae.AAC.2